MVPVPFPVPPGAASELARPLAITDDVLVLDALVALATDAGVELQVRPSLTSAGEAWQHAALVLVDAAAAARPDARPPSRRDGVVLVGTSADDASAWDAEGLFGAASTVVLPDAGPWLVELLRTSGQRPAEQVVVAVTGASGGVGASCLCVALAVSAARSGGDAVLVDADPHGGGLDLLLGAEDEPGARWSDLLSGQGALTLPASAIAAALDHVPQVGGVRVLSCSRWGAPAPSRAALSAVLRSPLAPLVLVDVGRGEALPEACSEVVLVAGEGVRAAAAAAEAAARLAAGGAVLHLVARVGRRGSQAAGRELADGLGLPLVAVLRPDPDLPADLARGLPPGTRPRGVLARVAASVLQARAVTAPVPSGRRAGEVPTRRAAAA